MLLGAFSTYTELTARVDKDVRHWQNDFYVQDNWRVTSRLTIDYGVRVQHSGSDYEVNNNHTGFFADQWQREPGGARVPAGLHHRRRRAIRPAGGEPARDRSGQSDRAPLVGVHRQHRAGQRAHQLNGDHRPTASPGAKDGTYFTFPYFVAAPRFGMAWNVTGDGKTALRASTGIFYNFPRSTGTGGYSFAGGCPVSCSNQIRWATFDDIAAAATPADLRCCRRPVNVNVGGLRAAAREVVQRQRRVPARHRLQHRRRRSPGSATSSTKAAAPSTSTGCHSTSTANPANLVNNAPLTANSLRSVYGKYPGMGSVDAVRARICTAKTLQYNAMQLQRPASADSRACRSASPTRCAKGEGYTGYDPYTDQIGGKDATHGALLGTDRRRPPAQPRP